MADTVTYEFTANHATELWSTDPAKMVDGTEASYASTTTDGDIQCLITNECVGTDLGTISKVEIAAYAYSDADDQLILRPVFGGSDDGDNHTTVPGVTAGWKAWQDITTDTNSPGGSATWYEQFASFDGSVDCYGANWLAQTFTPSVTHKVDYIYLELSVFGSSAGVVTLSIKATDGEGKPTGPDLTSGTKTVVELSPPYFNVTPYTLQADTKYALVLRYPGGDADNRVAWWKNAAGGYAGGNGLISGDSGSSWTGQTYDFAFKEGTNQWSWSDVQNLDCDVEQNDVSKGNTMYCGMVQIQVTYTAEAPPVGQPMRHRIGRTTIMATPMRGVY